MWVWEWGERPIGAVPRFTNKKEKKKRTVDGREDVGVGFDFCFGVLWAFLAFLFLSSVGVGLSDEYGGLRAVMSGSVVRFCLFLELGYHMHCGDD